MTEQEEFFCIAVLAMGGPRNRDNLVNKDWYTRFCRMRNQFDVNLADWAFADWCVAKGLIEKGVQMP